MVTRRTPVAQPAPGAEVKPDDSSMARRTRMTSPTIGAEVTTEGTQERQAMLAAAALRVRADKIFSGSRVYQEADRHQ